MKDNLNIEKLFQEKLKGLEGDVSPHLWNNIQSGLASNIGAAAAKTGVSLILKKVLIGTGIVAATATTVYFGFFNEDNNQPKNVAELVVSNGAEENTSLVENSIENEEDKENLTTTNTGVSETNAVNEGSVSSDNQTEETLNSTGNAQESNSTNTETTNIEGASLDSQGTDNGSENVSNDKTETNTSSEEVIPPVKTIAPPSGKIEMSTKSFSVPSEISFKSNAKNADKIIWNFGDGSTSNTEDVTHLYTQPGEYTVTLTIISEDEQVYTESQQVNIKTKSGVDNIPNVFTPDGDRINDLFTVETTELKSFYMVVYDRKGKIVFETQDAEFRWDGTDKGGNLLEKDFYTYIIKAEGNDGAIFNIPGEVEIR